MGYFILGVICGGIGTILLLFIICSLVVAKDADRRAGYED